MKLILIFLSFFTLAFQVISQSSYKKNSPSQVYSPFYLNKIDFNSTANSVPLNIKVAEDVDLVFVALGQDGMLVLDSLGQQKLFQASFGDRYISPFDVTDDGRYIIIGLQSQVMVYEYINPLKHNQQFLQISSCSFPTEVLDLVYVKPLNVVVAGGLTGVITVYDATQMNKISILASYNTQSLQISSVTVSNDGYWIYLACDIVGVVVLKLKITTVQTLNGGGITRQGSLLLAATGIGYRKSWQVAATHNQQYLFEIENWFGIFYAPFQQVVTSPESSYPIQLQFQAFWPFSQVSPTCQVMLISSSDQYLFVAMRSQGIFIFDISQPNDLRFYQQIQVNAQAYAAALSKTEQYLYYSNAQSVFTFSQNKPNLNNAYPNIFNTNQAIQFPMDGIYKWRCYVDPSNNYIIGAFDYFHLHVIPFYQDPYRLDPSSAVDLQIETDSVSIDPTGKYLFVPSLYSEKILTILQINPDPTDINNVNHISITTPKEISSFNVNSTYMSEQICNFAIITHQAGIFLFNTTDPLKFELIYYYVCPSFMIGENAGAILTKDNKWIISTVRSYGVYALDASDKTNLVLVDSIETLGGEDIYNSYIYEEYAYLVDGMNGFAIIDLKYLPKLHIATRVNLPGWTNMIWPIYNEQYILAAIMEDGMLALINIEDKNNARYIGSYQKDKQFSTSICLPKDESFVFISSPQGIITLPLQSQVMIHTEVSQVINGASSNTTIKFNQQQSLKNTTGLNTYDYVFSIGQIIQFNFVILYPIENMKITAVKVYSEAGQVIDLYYFMQYDPSTQTLVMSIDKTLQGNNLNSLNLNIILIETVIPLSAANFVFAAQNSKDIAVTNLSQANLILNYLQYKLVIDDKLTLIPGYNPNNNFIFDNYFFSTELYPNIASNDMVTAINQLTEKVKIVLVQSSYVNPVSFYVQPCLFFYTQEASPYIYSLSNTITFQIKSNLSEGIFVDQVFQGVVSSYSQTYDSLRLDGTLSAINQILSQQLIFANYTNVDMKSSTNSTSFLEVTISDSINYPINFSIPINRCNFIILKQQLQETNDLQTQVNRMYPDSIIFIEDTVSLIFAENSFTVQDSQNIKFTTSYTTGNINDEASYKEMDSEMWIQQDSSNKLSFHGNVPDSIYLRVYHFKVNATDGYTYFVDKFTLKVYGVPFTYIFNLLLKILGPTLAIFGIYKKRCIILNMIFKETVQFSEEVVVCNQKYNNKIILLGEFVKDSKILTNMLFAKIAQQDLKKLNKQSTYLTKDTANTPSSLTEFNHPYSPPAYGLIEKSVTKQECSSKMFIGNNTSLKDSARKKSQSALSTNKKHTRDHLHERLYLKENGNLSMSSIIKDICQHKLTQALCKTKSNMHDYEHDLRNVNSRIYRGIRAHSARHLLQFDKRSQTVYEFIKFYSQSKIHKLLNDWHKAVVCIDNNQQFDQNGILQTFPHLSLNIENIIRILIELKLFQLDDLSKVNTFNDLIREIEIRQLHLNFFLIREVLFADTLGYVTYTPSAFQPAIGESIHLQSHEIKQIFAFQDGNYKGWVRSLLKFFNLEYNKYGVQKNLRLPSWLQLDQKHGVLIFSGIPSTEDIEEVLIRIYDLSGYVIKQFILKVVDDKPVNENHSIFTIPNENDIEPFQLNLQSALSKKYIISPITQMQLSNDSKDLNAKKKFTFRSLLSPQLSAKQKQTVDYTQSFETLTRSFRNTSEPVKVNMYQFKNKENSRNQSEQKLDKSPRTQNTQAFFELTKPHDTDDCIIETNKVTQQNKTKISDQEQNKNNEVLYLRF